MKLLKSLSKVKNLLNNKDKDKNLLKEVIKGRMRKVIIIIAIVIIVISIFSAAHENSKVEDGILPTSEEDEGYSENCPAEYYKSIYITEQGTLMAEKSVKEMWDNDEKASSDKRIGYNKYLSNPDALAYLLNAQIVTQYPYIDSASGTDLNGTVRFYRNESKQPMAYINQDALQKYVDDYNNKGDTDSLAKALDSFSINNDGTITVAYLEEDYETLTTNDPDAASTAARDRDASSNSSGDGTYTVETSSSQLFTTTIAYQSLVRKYTLPFELLWAIAIEGNDGMPGNYKGNVEDFCYAMATMAYDGEIRLIIDDSNTVTTTTDNYKYDKEKKTEYSDIVLYRNGVGCYRNKYTTDPEKVGNFWVTNVDVNTVNSPSLKIGLIQSWCALYNNDAVFTSEETQGTPEKNSSQPKKTDWEENGGVKNEWSYENCPIGGIKRMFSRYVSNSRQTTTSGGTVNPGVTTTTESNSFKIVASGTNYKRYNNISQTTKVDTSTFSYTNGTVTSPAFNQDIADLINVDPYYNEKNYLLHSHYSYFMKIIKGNEATANMVDLINYIFNKVTDSEQYGKNLEWESIWEALYGGMDGFNGTSGLEGDIGRIADYFLSKGFTPEAVAAILGNMENESTLFSPRTVYNDYMHSNIEEFRQAFFDKISKMDKKTYANEGTGFGLVGFCFNVMREMLWDRAKARNVGLDDMDAQLETIHDYIQKYDSTLYNYLKTSTDLEEVTWQFLNRFENPGNNRAKLPARYKSAKNYYEKIKTNSLSGGTASSNEIANKVIKLAESKLGCKYVWGAKGPNTFDCSGLVYWCYKQVGINIPTWTGGYMPSYSKYKVNLKDIQPGDVLWRDDGSGNGHAGLYIGNDTFIHAPQTGDVVKKSSVSKYGKFMAGFRFWNK